MLSFKLRTLFVRILVILLVCLQCFISYMFALLLVLPRRIDNASLRTRSFFMLEIRDRKGRKAQGEMHFVIAELTHEIVEVGIGNELEKVRAQMRQSLS